jgi:hypothetical protein
MAEQQSARSLASFRPWFRAAAAYNLAWGLAAVLAPRAMLSALGMRDMAVVPFWQVIGLFVLVFAPGYLWAAADPVRHGHLVLIGLAGKVLGAIGFAVAAVGGTLPLSIGATILTNDVIWLPAFIAFSVHRMRVAGSWRALLRGV